MVEVLLDAMLSQFVPQRRCQSDATSLEGLIDELEARFPRLRFRLRDETRTMRPFVKIFVNGEEVPRESESSVRLSPRDEVQILHSIQGG